MGNIFFTLSLFFRRTIKFRVFLYNIASVNSFDLMIKTHKMEHGEGLEPPVIIRSAGEPLRHSGNRAILKLSFEKRYTKPRPVAAGE